MVLDKDDTPTDFFFFFFCKVCFHIKPVSVTSFYATTTVKEKPGSVHLFLLFLLSKTQKSRNSQLTKLQVGGNLAEQPMT